MVGDMAPDVGQPGQRIDGAKPGGLDQRQRDRRHDPLPGSVLGSIEIDGDQIRTVDGTAIDADGDGIAGG